MVETIEALEKLLNNIVTSRDFLDITKPQRETKLAVKATIMSYPREFLTQGVAT